MPVCENCGMAHEPEDKAACIEGHGDDPARPEPTVTKSSGLDCDWTMFDETGEMYPHGIIARKRVSDAGEFLDGDYCLRHAKMAVEWWREGIEPNV